VSSYIERNKHSLLGIKDLLLTAYGMAEELPVEQVSSIAYASILFGGSLWTALP